MHISKEKYLADPCGILSIPYWKAKNLNLPDNMLIINNNDYNDSYKDSYTDELYFRLIHRLENINSVNLNSDYLIGTVDIHTQLEDVVDIINNCYTDIGTDINNVMKWTKSIVFDNNLWVYIKEIKTGKIVALGIAEFDKEINEAALEWIQVLPSYHGKGLGQAIVNELLNRLKCMADFVTVSGKVDNLTNPEALYRKCGFNGNDVWHILTKKI